MTDANGELLIGGHAMPMATKNPATTTAWISPISLFPDGLAFTVQARLTNPMRGKVTQTGFNLLRRTSSANKPSARTCLIVALVDRSPRSIEHKRDGGSSDADGAGDDVETALSACGVEAGAGAFDDDASFHLREGGHDVK